MTTRISPSAITASTLILISCLWFALPRAFAASASSVLIKAKQEAESKGYVFFTNRDEIISKAKREGKVNVRTQVRGSLQATTEAFKKKYPFIDITSDASSSGVDDNQRLLLELKAGRADWDIMRTSTTFYSEYLPHLWKIDLLGMAELGVTDIPPKMIDPKNRNVIALTSQVAVVPYNKNLVSPGQLPRSWDDMLKPEWTGKKFALEAHPSELAALVPAWGLERTLDFARKIAAQHPIWSRGTTRPLASIASGEIPLLLFGAAYGPTIRAQRKDPLGGLQYVILEPVPAKARSEHAIVATSRNPHAAFLWLEFMASTEAQALIDRYEPLEASFYSKGSAAEQLLRGKTSSEVSWEHHDKMEQWIAKLVEALGFPKVQTK